MDEILLFSKQALQLKSNFIGYPFKRRQKVCNDKQNFVFWNESSRLPVSNYIIAHFYKFVDPLEKIFV